MKNTKRSITLKIIAGYTLAIVLAVIAFWVIYRQFSNYSEITKIKNDNNEKLFLVGEAITGLYEAESLTRNIIQTSDTEKFKNYKTKIDSIISTIDRVSTMSLDTLQSRKIDSIKVLIDNKNQNFEKLIAIYEQSKEKGLQENVMDQLKKNENFGNYTDYDKRFRKYSPQKKEAIIAWLEYTRKDNEERLTNQTIDSIARSIYQALSDAEEKERRYQRQIKARENKLLKNDQIITRQLRDLMAAIEDNERKEYVAKLERSNNILDKTAQFIIIITAISLIIAITFLFLITKDVSKSQKYRNELEAEKTYKETLLKTRESLINTVTHDLRSPLNTVIGYSDLLEKTGLTNKQKHYLGHLKKSSDYILHLVNDLLDLSKLEAGRMVIEELPFSPKKLIENTITSIIPVNDTKNLEVFINVDKSLNKQYLGDPFRIKQILTNLLNNAYKFTDQGSITIDGKITENGLAEKELVISVKDTGIGITKEQQKYIFEEFSQGDDDTEKKYGGFGLGLAITKKIIKLLNGKIKLESEVEKGSNFIFCIPIELAKTQITEEDNESVEIQHFTNKKVLIVDDDLSQLDLTSEVVSLIGLSYDIAEHGIDALELLNKNEYDLILTDIQMPKMDGFELLKEIQNNSKYNDLPIIALSGRTAISLSEYEDAGFSGSLRKPYAPQALIDLIAGVLKIKTIDVDLGYENNTSDQEKDANYSLNDLMLFAQGDSESLYAILETFCNSTIDHITELKSAISNEDFEQIKRLAHKMLPMFKQIKAREIVPILNTLEHQDDYEFTPNKILSLTEEGIHKIEDLINKLKVKN
ncbi:response regulator [Aquimarina sp. MMG015]|uniref:hybrid sensor histidine kinase/response regulator n=1 Tax=unclassified Aquimarina TaxID=2627091 RepID=UPI000D5521F2|nr:MULTISPECIES: hybrid sensor histidine kinase/response regulator [unclassified Aquimarina]AXT56988.1 response regulator [Aquimarina sp. AD1]MBQ4801767.1 response regulator [Aquimarina sp. MMG015]RKN36940.1 response regulator [Aquimarina sp. AD1]